MMSLTVLNILGKRQKSMQAAHLCTVWAGRQWLGKASRQRGRDYVCMQVTDMQFYSNTYGCMCSNQSYQWEASTRDLEVVQHAGKSLATDSYSYLIDPKWDSDLER